MMKVCRPFWSYDVQKTEKWLSSMAEKGFHLERINTRTRCFYFSQGKERTVTYRICYKMTLPQSLSVEGWGKILENGQWSVIALDKKEDQIKKFPSRESIRNRNRKVMFAFGGILTYLTAIAAFNIAVFLRVFISNTPVEVVESPFWILTYILLVIVLCLYGLSIYSVIKVVKTNRNLRTENLKINPYQVDLYEIKLSRKQEKELKRRGELIVKRKGYWSYSPDKLENWLESMEERGFNLYKISKSGLSFFFITGEPRKIKYCIDYQNSISDGYFDIHSEAGWKNIYTTSSFQKFNWIIWGKPYDSKGEPPTLYSDRSHLLRHAKRIGIMYTALFLPLVLTYIWILSKNLSRMENGIASSITDIYNLLFFIYILAFSSFVIRPWLFYLRLKKTNQTV